jgi:hypothetical protein
MGRWATKPDMTQPSRGEGNRTWKRVFRPFVLSLSKDFPSLGFKERKGFDKLGPNG